MKALFPGERPSAQQSVFVIEADGAAVGDLSVADRNDVDSRCLWVYALEVDEAYRGRGYGKAAMLLVEDEARRRGVDRLGLNVSGGNTTARRLYRSLGYTDDAVKMSKRI